MHFYLQLIDRETGRKLGGAKPIVARDQAHAEEMAIERVLDYKHHVELLDISRKKLAKLIYQGPLFGAEKEQNPIERQSIHYLRGYNKGMAVARQLQKTSVDDRSEMARRYAAAFPLEQKVEIANEFYRGLATGYAESRQGNPPPHYDSTMSPYEAGRLLGEYQKSSLIGPSFDSIVAHYRRWQKAAGLKPTRTRPHTASVLIPRLQSEPQWKDFNEGYAAGRPSARRENPDDPHNLLEQDRSLRVGQEVLARWGYGGGFRAQGRGVITKLYDKSVRVKLLEDVMFGDKIGWPAGFVLKGIPRFGTREWVPENSVAPLASAELQGAA